MAAQLLDFFLPNPTLSRLLLVADFVLVAVLGWAAWRMLGLVLSVPLAFLALTWLGMATNDFFVALALFHFGCGLLALLTLRRHRLRWVTCLGMGLVIATPLLGLLR